MSASRFSTDGLGIPAPAPAALDPADANYTGAWNETLGKLGLSVIVIQMDRCNKVFADAEFIESLGEEMNRAGLGRFDSVQYEPRIRFFFYAGTACLGEALNFLKSGLEKCGLMDLSAIGYFDATEKIWRTFHPGT